MKYEHILSDGFELKEAFFKYEEAEQFAKAIAPYDYVGTVQTAKRDTTFIFNEGEAFAKIEYVAGNIDGWKSWTVFSKSPKGC